MKCQSCEKDMGSAEWKYCPYCGESISKKPLHAIGMQDIAEKIIESLEKRLTKKLLATYSYAQKKERAKSGALRIRIVPETASGTRNPVKDIPVKENIYKDTSKRPVAKETIEPATDITRLPDRLRISVALPGIESMDDIDILEFENSSEVRAYTGDTLYFKIIEIPQDLTLASKSLESGKLTLEFTR